MKKADKVADVAILGPPGTFTEEAAKKMFPGKTMLHCDTVEDVFDEVEKGMEYGVVAIENSLEGSVNTTMDSLMEHDLKINKEMILDIHLNLLVIPGTKKEGIKTIMSHPHALPQCRIFLKKNYPQARLKSLESTTAAVKEVRQLGSKQYAAIGPKDAAPLYSLEILEREIEDAPSQTRFIAVSKNEGEGEKTSIIFMLKDRPGALYHALGDFAEAKLNLTKIESRPSKKKLGEYSFYIDFEGSLKDEKVKKALEELRKKTTYLKVLGSY